MTIERIIDSIELLPPDSNRALANIAVERKFRKGHLLLRAGRVENSLYLIRKGIVRAWSLAGDKEITFWFGTEGDAVLSMRSYIENLGGYEDVELLEDCELYQLNTVRLRDLYRQDIHIANWGRRLAEKELFKTEQRLISREFRNARERYLELLNDNPGLIHRVQLGHIASYLGITQVSLSRIRAEIR